MFAETALDILNYPHEVDKNIQTLKYNRFVLIKAWGCGFWSDMSHVLGQLLFSELTNRIPIINWGANSLYNDSDEDVFKHYFSPISEYTISDLVGKNFTFYPSIWRENNLTYDDPNHYYRGGMENVIDFMSRSEDVIVSDYHMYVSPYIPYIPKEHPAYGLGPDDVYRYLIKKYIRLQPWINNEIEQFYNEKMENKHILGVHVRESDKTREIPRLHEINQLYCNEINGYLQRNPSANIFLITDCENILSDYITRYGNILIYTDCMRTNVQGIPAHYQTNIKTKRKGVEILKDTYLAAKCYNFLGNIHSNVSIAVRWLKPWHDGDMLLHGGMLH